MRAGHELRKEKPDCVTRTKFVQLFFLGKKKKMGKKEGRKRKNIGEKSPQKINFSKAQSMEFFIVNPGIPNPGDFAFNFEKKK